MAEELQDDLQGLSTEEKEKLKKLMEKDSKSYRSPTGFFKGLVAVLGAGIMGGGIAYQSALKGVPIKMKDIAQEGLDLGLSDSSGEAVSSILRRTLPVSIALIVPGFIIGNLLGLVLGLTAAWFRGSWLDRLVMGASVMGMSISFLVIIIALQVLLCTPYGLNLFPVRGWQVTGLGSYLYYVTVPTLALVLVTLGYNTRFYRAVCADELEREHIFAARAFHSSSCASVR